MSIRMKPHPLLLLGILALFLYWVVQDPIGAAAMLDTVFDAIVHFAQMVANRVVEFLNALL
jgi:hypothetical protein